MKGKEMENKKTKKGKTIATLAAGAAVGAGLGILGRQYLRHLFMQKQAEFKKKIKEIEKEIKELDKEKVLNIASQKASEIKNKAEDLVELAREKGNEALEKTAKELREKAINVTKSVLAKLEEK